MDVTPRKRHLSRLRPAGLLGLVPLFACGPLERYRVAYEQHDREYRANVQFDEHRVPVGDTGHTLYAREFSGSSAESGPLILLLHGIPDSLHLYDLLAAELGSTHRVVSFDFLGWGQSDKPEDIAFDFRGLRRDLDAVLGYFDPRDGVALVVHDTSGVPGIEFALDEPERVRALILLNTVYRGITCRELPEAIDRFSTLGFSRDAGVFLATRNTSAWQKGVGNQLKKFFVRDDPRQEFVPVLCHQAQGIRPAFFGLAGVYKAEVEVDNPAGSRMAEFDAPVHIVFGAEDPYLDAKLARAFHESFPRSRLDLVEDAGHYVQLDQPQRVSHLIRETLAAIPRRQTRPEDR